MMENPVTDLPEPDSPTCPRTSPRPTVKLTPSTARATPARVKKCVCKSSTAKVGRFAVRGDTSAALALQPGVQHVAELVSDEIVADNRSEEHTSELQSLMRISYAVFCLKKKKNTQVEDRRSTTH